MDIFDTINASFQFGAGFALSTNLVNLYKAKKVRGVSIWSQIFMCVWGVFAIAYFIKLDQLLSTLTACFVFLINLTWFFMMLYYIRKENSKEKIPC